MSRDEERQATVRLGSDSIWASAFESTGQSLPDEGWSSHWKCGFLSIRKELVAIPNWLFSNLDPTK